MAFTSLSWLPRFGLPPRRLVHRVRALDGQSVEATSAACASPRVLKQALSSASLNSSFGRSMSDRRLIGNSAANATPTAWLGASLAVLMSGCCSQRRSCETVPVPNRSSRCSSGITDRNARIGRCRWLIRVEQAAQSRKGAPAEELRDWPRHGAKHMRHHHGGQEGEKDRDSPSC